MVIGIIGGGASGMAAALAASENPVNQIILMERQSRLGRKLQATGNGRCNLSNLYAAERRYHGDNPQFTDYAIGSFPPEKTLSWFRKMGLFTVSEESGRVYPYSDQANSVLDVLRFALEKENIQVLTGFEVEKVRKTAEGFQIESAEESIHCERLIIACGGLAGTKLGGTMSGYKILRSFGHHCTRLRPSLVQIKTNWPAVVSLKGVRANCKAAIYCDNALHTESEGEIQFTEYGLSGPVIFEISRDVCQQKGNWICQLDLIPHISAEELSAELNQRRQSQLSASELFTGILHNRLGRVVTQDCGINLNSQISELSDAQITAAVAAAKCFCIKLTETMGMDSAQVTAGGIMTNEFDSCTMESRFVPSLFACGEVLDIDGDCGGYNLQWAWSSGYLAGACAGGVQK